MVPSVRTGFNGGYTLDIIYQVLNELGAPMNGSQLKGVSISESFLMQTGNLSDLNKQVGIWSYPQQIDGAGRFTDVLNSGGLPGFPRSGTALQEFMAFGSFGLQPLDIKFFGTSYSGVNFNSYSPNLVTVNGMTATRSCGY